MKCIPPSQIFNYCALFSRFNAEAKQELRDILLDELNSCITQIQEIDEELLAKQAFG